MRLPKEFSGDDSHFVILPIPYECSPTYGAGASKGPATIIQASEHLEYYDEQFDCEPFEKGVMVLDAPKLSDDPEKMVQEVSSFIDEKSKNKFPLILGGDHAVTIGATGAFPDDVDVLILDAHADMKFSWNNSQYNHACVARRLSVKRKVGVVGVRSMDIDEARDIEKNENVQIVKAYDYNEHRLNDILNHLGEKVFVSIDVDVFDPSFIRNTGTPEPGGFSWDVVVGILKKIFEQKNIVGADIVEFAPQGSEENYRVEAYALARLAYKIMALKN